MTAQATQILKFFRLLVFTLIVSRSLYSCLFVPTTPPPMLFTQVTPPAGYSAPPKAVADHLRVVTLEPALLKQSQFSLPLFDAKTHIVLLDRMEEQRNGNFTWIGHLAGDHASQVTITVQDQVVSGVIQVATARYELLPLHDNLYTFYEQDPTA